MASDENVKKCVTEALLSCLSCDRRRRRRHRYHRQQRRRRLLLLSAMHNGHFTRNLQKQKLWFPQTRYEIKIIFFYWETDAILDADASANPIEIVPKMVKRNAWSRQKTSLLRFNSSFFYRGRAAHSRLPCGADFVDDSAHDTPAPVFFYVNFRTRKPLHPHDSKNNWKTLFTFVVCRFLFVWSVTSFHFWCLRAAHYVTYIYSIFFYK